MAQLRGSTNLWVAATVNPADDTTIYSAPGYVGAGPWVTVYITTDEDATFKVQVGVNPTGVEAGHNAFDGDDLPDGGMDWFDYRSQDANTIDTTALALTAGQALAFDLSPFGPQLMRLVRTDSGTTGTVTAYLTAYGAN